MLRLWEILVPMHIDGTAVLIAHHQLWDAQVMEISGGMTIYKPAIGFWLDRSVDAAGVIRERMIPVRIACTEGEIKQIADMTLSHYRQKAVMYYLVSEQVEIKYAEER